MCNFLVDGLVWLTDVVRNETLVYYTYMCSYLREHNCYYENLCTFTYENIQYLYLYLREHICMFDNIYVFVPTVW